MACNKTHSESSLRVMNELPYDQGGRGRHKCAACAYERGYQDGLNLEEKIDLKKVIDSLDYSQALPQRHKSPHAAYAKGYVDGVRAAYQ